MLFYVGKNFTATLNGTVMKQAVCEHCRTEYFYQLARTGFGRGTAPYFIGQGAAARRAQAAAKKSVEKRLKTETECVPCPSCGWIQHPMVQGMRKGRYRPLSVFAWMLGSIALFIELLVGLLMYMDHNRRSGNLGTVAEWIVVTICGIGALLSLRKWLLHRIDPNRAFPQRPVVPAGSPPALVREKGADGIARFVPAGAEPVQQSGDWAEVQVQRCVLPKICCVCASRPSERVFKPPFEVTKEMPAPLCAECNRRIIIRWWLWAGASLLMSVAVAAGLALTARKMDTAGRWSLFTIVSIIGSIAAAAVIPRWRVMPYRQKWIDRSRGVARLWFINPAFTRQLMELYAARATVNAQIGAAATNLGSVAQAARN